MRICYRLDRQRVKALHEAETAAFGARMPRSRELSAWASSHLLFGVPLH